MKLKIILALIFTVLGCAFLTSCDAEKPADNNTIITTLTDTTKDTETIKQFDTTQQVTEPDTTEEATTAETTKAPEETTVPVTKAPETTAPVTKAPETIAPQTTKKQQTEPVEDNGDKYIAFTFDDGPHSTLTYKFVDKLKEYNAKATFFIVANRLTDKTVKALNGAINIGCEIGSHSYSHKFNFRKCTDAEYNNEIETADKLITEKLGIDVTLLRPPGGNITDERLAASKYSVILWSVDTNDWRYKNRDTEQKKTDNINIIVNNIMSTVKSGDIILMHEIYENSYDAFSIAIDKLAKKGYKFVTVSELLKLNADSVGHKYRHA